MIAFLKRAWIPLLVIAVVVISGFTVHRIRTFFGSDGIITTPRVFADDPESFDPKVVKYEIWGEGGTANVNYLDLDAKPQRVDNAALPWSVTLETSAPSAAPTLLAQGDGNSISCRITVDGEVKDERTADGVNALTYCFVKSA
jgi:hypothetical protein